MNNRIQLSWRCLAALSFLASGIVQAEATAGSLFLAFTPDPARQSGVSPEACWVEPGMARGFLTTSASDSHCHTASWGTPYTAAFVGDQEVAVEADPALFTGEPLAEALPLDGRLTLRVYYSYETPAYDVAEDSVFFELQELRDDESIGAIAFGYFQPSAGTYADSPSYYVHEQDVTVAFDARTVPAGSRLRVYLESASPSAEGGRLIYGGASFGDAGITLTLPPPAEPDPTVDPLPDPTGNPDPAPDPAGDPSPDPSPVTATQPEAAAPTPSGGGMGVTLLAPLFGLLALRRLLPLLFLPFLRRG